MSRLVPLTKIVITGNKGGTGKTTITALLAEYLTYQKKKVNLIDTDPSQALKFWLDNCQQVKTTKTTGTVRITFALNANLVQQAENLLNSWWVQQDYTYSSLSELIRKSLQTYQNKEININLTERDKHAPKREIAIRFFNADLLNYYYSLPYSQRTAIIEESLRAYLDKLNARELEKYRKIIPAKPKKPKPKPKLTPHFNANFICDSCGDRYEQDTAYSPVRDWVEERSYITYCSNCVG